MSPNYKTLRERQKIVTKKNDWCQGSNCGCHYCWGKGYSSGLFFRSRSCGECAKYRKSEKHIHWLLLDVFQLFFHAVPKRDLVYLHWQCRINITKQANGMLMRYYYAALCYGKLRPVTREKGTEIEVNLELARNTLSYTNCAYKWLLRIKTHADGWATARIRKGVKAKNEKDRVYQCDEAHEIHNAAGIVRASWPARRAFLHTILPILMHSIVIFRNKLTVRVAREAVTSSGQSIIFNTP